MTNSTVSVKKSLLTCRMTYEILLITIYLSNIMLNMIDEQGWSEECLVFMQHLANRYFNRAIFFLTTSADHENPKEAQALGFRDLQITGDMDEEIVNQCLESGFRINRVERYELMLGRVRGLNALIEDGYNSDELYLDEQIKSLQQDLNKAIKSGASNPLFSEISVAGRMQKLDVELIRYLHLAKNDSINAARVAIRMLMEDEYVFVDAEEEAIKMILLYMSAANDENCPPDDDGLIVKELQSTLRTIEDDFVQRFQRASSSFNDSSGSAGRLRSLNMSIATNSERSVKGKEESLEMSRRSSAFRSSRRNDTTMELF